MGGINRKDPVKTTKLQKTAASKIQGILTGKNHSVMLNGWNSVGIQLYQEHQEMRLSRHAIERIIES